MLCLVFLGVFLADLALAKTIEFTVQKGDNFWKLSKKYNVKHSLIIRLNRDKLKYQDNPDLIYPGQKFIVEIADKAENAAASSKKPIMIGDKKIAENAIVSISKPIIVGDKKINDNLMSAQTERAITATSKDINENKKTVQDNKDGYWRLRRFFKYIFILLCLSVVPVVFLILLKERTSKKVKNSKNRYIRKYNENSSQEKPAMHQKNDDVIDSSSAAAPAEKKEIAEDMTTEVLMISGDNYKVKKLPVLIDGSKNPILDGEKCFVGIDQEGTFHFIGSEIQINGTLDYISSLAAKIYGKAYEEFIVYIDDAKFGEIFTVRPLTQDERLELENKIKFELENINT